MQPLYVTDFELAPSPGSEDVVGECADVALEHVASWLSESFGAVTASDLYGEGDVEAPHPRPEYLGRRASWQHKVAGQEWATRLVHRDIHTSGEQFVVTVLIGVTQGKTRMQVTMGREADGGSLTPTRAPDVRQPRLVRNLAFDSRISLRAQGQVQDGRFVNVRGEEAVVMLGQALSSTRRLPTLLVHSRTEESYAATKRAANGLVGLCQVVTLDLRASRRLADIEARARVPYGGALLVWADIESPAWSLPADVVSARSPDTLRAMIMSRIAPLTVLTRKGDALWQEVSRKARQAELASAAERTAQAAASGSQDDLVAALESERDSALAEVDEALAIGQAAEALAEERAAEIARLTAQVKDLGTQVEQLQVALQYAAPTVPDNVLNFENAPELVTGDAASMDALGAHLEQATDGRIVFTPNAAKSWKKASRYPDPGKMRDQLVALARAAAVIYDGSAREMGHLDSWMRTEFNLKFAHVDDQMPASFRIFNFDDRQYDRTPHVKVDDGVPHWACGRIYLALDKPNDRMIVDHVGIKW